jgi:hypothetical protein
MGTSSPGIKGEKRRKGIEFLFHPLPSSVRYLSRMRPSLPPINNSLTIGIDDTASEEVFQGFFFQLLTVAEVVIQHPLFYLDPILSLEPYDFHGNHPPSF